MMSLLPEHDDFLSALQESVQGWAEQNLAPSVAKRDEEAMFDKSLYERLDSELGLMNTTLPTELNGSALNFLAPIVAIEALSTCDPGMAMSYLAQEILFSHQLYHTWRALERPMPDYQLEILKEKKLSGMAMTEPNAGTDVLGMSTTAVKTDRGFLINGTKQWITNGSCGDVFLVYAKTGEGRKDISLFVVTSKTPGVCQSSCEQKMGMRTSDTGILTFTQCEIPHESLVGNLHEGIKPMLRNLAVERLSLAAQACGIAKTCVNTMCHYASERTAFGAKIANFGQIQKFVAESHAGFLAMRSMLYQTADALLADSPSASCNADAAKLFCTGCAEQIARSAIQVLGANGYSNAYPVSRLYRDAILLSIGGGTNEALQKNISRLLMPRISSK